MSRRYKFLNKDSTYKALNKLRTAFLAAKNSKDVDKIIMGVLTNDERMKIGRRIQVAQLLVKGKTHREIMDTLKVGSTTIMHVERKLDTYIECFELIFTREKITNLQIKNASKQRVGGSKKIFKNKVYPKEIKKAIKR